MPKIRYEDKRFSAESLKTIEIAETICNEYTAQGYVLTLRQLYYQFVARGHIENSIQSYKRLGSVVNDARMAGLIDWNAIEDRTRNLEKLPSWESPQSIIEACAQQFKYDMWEKQPYRIEDWVEKEALVGVIERVSNRYRVPYFACRGYTSQSEAWRAGRRFMNYNRGGQKVVVLHVGDHDPSGIDMTRDNRDRLDIFAQFGDVEVKRLALNFEQVQQYNPPPNPAKMTDARFDGYQRKFGDQSWELDALGPSVIEALFSAEIEKLIDWDQWHEDERREEEARRRIQEVADTWAD